MSDVRRIRKAKKGDKEALIALIMEQKSDYYKLAYTYMKNKEDTLDVMQEMILILYQNIDTLRKDEVFYSWSKTILVNLCKKTLVANKKVVSLESVREVKDNSYTIESALEDKIVLERHLSGLKPIHEEVIKLRYVMDYDYDTIAIFLNIPLGTVKSRINTAMKRLKESLEGEITHEEYR